MTAAVATCRSGKVRYESQTDARKALTRILRVRAVEGRKQFEQRAYECQGCGGWHLTSMPWGGR